eukprot:5253108-Karenia_brevis.AAC.1
MDASHNAKGDLSALCGYLGKVYKKQKRSMPPKVRASYAQLLLDIGSHEKDQPLILASLITPSSAPEMPQPVQVMSEYQPMPAFNTNMTTL